jgi:hypothetical protein
MERNDIQGVDREPASVKTYLLRKGGRNIYDEPNFRLVFATSRLKKQGGRWQDWDKNLNTNERGGIITLASGLMVPSHYRPERVVTEVRTVRKYCFPGGWLLERWIPSVYYGAEADWYMRCVPGTSVPFGGPWPQYGDYEMCHYTPTVVVPTITELQNAIDRSEKSRNTQHSDIKQIVLERVNEAEDAYQKELTAERLEAEATMRDMMTPLHSTRLSAGAYRTKLAERAGIRSHQGN